MMVAKLTLTLEDLETGAARTETRSVMELYESEGGLLKESTIYLGITQPREDAVLRMFHDAVTRIARDLLGA